MPDAPGESGPGGSAAPAVPDAPDDTGRARRVAFFARLRAPQDTGARRPPELDPTEHPPTRFPTATATGAAPAPRTERCLLDVAPGDGAASADLLLAAVLAALGRYTASTEVVVGLSPAVGTSAVLAVPTTPEVPLGTLARRLPGASRYAAAPTPVLLRLREPADVVRELDRPAPLTIDVLPAQGRVRVLFDPDRHERPVLTAFLGVIEALFRHGVRAPERPQADALAERADDLTALNDTATEIPPTTVSECFAATARRHGSRLAVADARGSRDYTGLAADAGRLANHLAALGIRREDRVGVLVSRGDLRMVVAVLGVLHTGAAWLPIDPATPSARVTELLNLARVRAVVTDGALRGHLAGPWPVVDLDAAAGTIAAADARPPAVPVEPGNAAYTIFTSGSTGTPRAVLVEHRSVVNFVGSYRRVFAVSPDDRMLQFASPGFDVWVQEVFVALLTGAALFLADDEQRLSAAALERTLREERITIAELPPVLMRGMSPERFPELRVVSVGGESFAGSLVTEWSAEHRVINGYGPTEATVGVVYRDCTGERRSAPPIGRPVDNQRCHVLDAALRPVPFGAVGELYLGGAGVARGYADDPGATAARFVADPFGRPGARLLRTGDLARRDAAGDLVFVGRDDRQVKVGGQRVELVEIESALLATTGVRAAVVDLRGRQDGGATERRLVGWYVGDADPEAIRAELTARLPRHMVPSSLVAVPRIPLNANGKTDLRALDAPPVDASSTPADRLTPTQRRLLDECLVGVLGVGVGPDTDFFAAGATSLQVVRLLTRVHRVFGVEVPVPAFLRTPTLATLAELVERPAGARQEPLPLAPDDADVPLFPGQRGIWLAHLLADEPAAYHVVEAYRVRGTLDVAALRRACTTFVRRHDMVRTKVLVRDGLPRLVADPVGELDWREIDTDEAGLPGSLSAVAREPFDLSAGRLLRVALVRLAPSEHVVCFVLHHLASDGRSTEVMFAELGRYYRERTTPTVPPLRYRDVAWWQARRSDDRVTADLSYWRDRLAGAPAECGPPPDRPRTPASGLRGATLRVPLDAHVVEGVRALGRSAGTTVFVTLLTGFVALLTRYSRDRDIVLGTPVANRNRAELADVVGYLSTMLAVRVDATGAPTFTELLARTKETVLQAFAHADAPFERVVREFAPERVPGRHPLFQVSFQAYDVPEPPALPGVDLETYPVDTGASQFDLAVAVQLAPDGGMTALFTYRTELFDDTTVSRLAGHYQRLLASAVTDPTRRNAALAMLSDEERAALREVNATGSAERTTITALFARRLAATPDTVAVVSAQRTLTYRELDQQANRIARLLLARGAGAAAPVAVCLPRSPTLVAVLLGVLKAGAPYLPIDPTHPPVRMALMLADARARVLVTERACAETLSRGDVTVPPVDIVHAGDLPDLLAGVPESAPEREPHPDQLAYLSYTSGSTGAPKAVAVSHHAVVRLVTGLDGLGGWSPSDRFLMLASTAFDASTFEIWTPLTHGAGLVVYPPGPVDPATLGAVLAEHRVTVLWLTAQLTNLITDTVPAALAPLRMLITGGEALSGEHVTRLRATLPELVVVNGYGPTETTTFCTTHRAAGPTATVPIGTPIGDTRVYVLDDDLRPVPVGVPGQLFVAGSGLARGYLGQPGLTAERFVADPFQSGGRRMYRTGDLVRWLPGGVLDFVGRLDEQLKLRGFRVEPEEVATTLRETGPVADAYVTVSGAGMTAELLAYLVPADRSMLDDAAPGSGRAAAEAAVRAELGTRLPPYLLPDRYLWLDTLPLSANGKVDRAALPEDTVYRTGEGTAPRTPEEDGVAAVWARVLGRGDVGVFDNFFHLGGNSLLAFELTAGLSERFGTRLPASTVFQYPTVAGQAATLATVARDGTAPTLARDERWHGPAPLSSGQRGLWFLDQLRPGSAAYNVPVVLRLRGPLDEQALRHALHDVVTRHEVLRSRFVRNEDGWPVQQVLPAHTVPFRTDDLRSLGAHRAVGAALGLAEQDAAEPFVLADGPLLRVRLARLSAEDNLVAVIVHHAAFDGASTGLLVAELGEVYRARRAGVEPSLPVLHRQYADYAVGEAERAGGRDLDSGLAYWRRQLAGVPALLLAGYHPAEPAAPPEQGARWSGVVLPAPEREAMAAFGAERDATEFMVLLGALQALLSGLGAGTDIAVGTPVSLREDSAHAPLIGYFVNLVVLRTDLSGDPPFTTVLERARATALAGYAHRNVPFETVVDALNPTRGRFPLCTVVFSVRDERNERTTFPELSVERVDVYNGTAKFDLDVALVHRDDGLHLVLEFRESLFDEAAAKDLAERYRRVLRAALIAPETPVSRLADG